MQAATAPRVAQLKKKPSAKTIQRRNAAKRKVLPALGGKAQLQVLNRQVEQLQRAGKYKQAVPIARRALVLTEQIYGRNHPAVATALTRLAGLYRHLRRYAEAEALYKSALAIRQKALGPSSPDVAASFSDLAALYRLQGRTAEAKRLSERALSTQKKSFSAKSAKPEGFAAKQLAPRHARRYRRSREKSAAAPRARGLLPEAAPPGASTPPSGGAAREPTIEAQSRSVAKAKKAPTDWDVVPVFFGTDRNEQPNPKRLSYGAERGHRLALGRALVTVPKIHQVPQIERPWALRIPYFDITIYQQAEDPKKHFTMQEIKKLSKEDFLRLVRERLKTSQRFKDNAIVFVHGFNTTFDNAVYRTAQISYDLKFDGAAFVYSWPSGGSVASYTYDRANASAAEPYLRQFLELVIKESGAKSISLIAHSMGNLPLLDVLKDMKAAAPKGVEISQVILAAPDVDADTFANLARRIEGFAKGVTLYASSNDRALMISRNFWQNPRAGDVLASGPLIIPGVDTIDITAASTDAFALNHSEYAQNNDVLHDIGKLILSGLRPPDQRLPSLKRIISKKGDYWKYIAPAE